MTNLPVKLGLTESYEPLPASSGPSEDVFGQQAKGALKPAEFGALLSSVGRVNVRVQRFCPAAVAPDSSPGLGPFVVCHSPFLNLFPVIS